MKFKPIYLYGLLVVASIAILIFVTRQDSSEPNEIPINNNQTMPEDDVHKQLRNQGSNLPSKENVSEEYQRKLAELKIAVEKNCPIGCCIYTDNSASINSMVLYKALDSSCE